MIEIAISLAVIGFALVAIVGLLPMGLNTQKDNREETIVSQDGAYLIEAIRGGIIGVDMLTNYVDHIVITNHPPLRGVPKGFYYSYGNGFTNGAEILELLTTPKCVPDVTRTNLLATNEVIAYIRALSGDAVAMGTNNKAMAFMYEVRPEITKFSGWDTNSTNFSMQSAIDGLTQEEIVERSNRWTQVRYLTNNLYEVRLRYAWPVLPNYTVSQRPKVQYFRTQVSAAMANGVFEPQMYQFQ